ncbi:hypothetical protein CKM354_001188500 [Cercospora kikuchii]|uniref:Uncharacterized protein n=1 Tax=Cercospora kikuchii TaxID=84275 RepID=A0A9P3FIR4_9PEZI|nr:uncharacterized protein CKM354_001188500 [Cercospora kikuchii]GIZ48841.1 hypothetical protein CKM354_001188500 [Cercospora kikuchii]
MIFVLYRTLQLLSSINNVAQRFVLPFLINLFHGMTLADALRQEEHAGENVIRQQVLIHQQLTPSAWLRGSAPETWEPNEREFEMPVFHGHDLNRNEISDIDDTSCVDISQDDSQLDCIRLDTSTLSNSQEDTTSGTRSASTSLRLNRFERHRDEIEDMHLLMIGRQIKGHRNGELKFRTDFEACFKDFPLEHMYEAHWSCHSPVSAQTSIRSSRASSNRRGDLENASPLPQQEGGSEECEVYEDAKVKGMLNDIMLPRNLDGSPMAELDASPTQCDTGHSANTLSSPMLPSFTAESPIRLRPRLASDRLSKMLATLRPLSWAKRASIHLKQIRHSALLPDHPLDERTFSNTEDQTSSKPIWDIRSIENALVYNPRTLDVTIEHGGLEMPSSFSSPTELKNPALVLTSLPQSDDCDSESSGDDDSDDLSLPEGVTVGGCWIAVASHEQ